MLRSSDISQVGAADPMIVTFEAATYDPLPISIPFPAARSAAGKLQGQHLRVPWCWKSTRSFEIQISFRRTFLGNCSCFWTCISLCFLGCLKSLVACFFSGWGVYQVRPWSPRRPSCPGGDWNAVPAANPAMAEMRPACSAGVWGFLELAQLVGEWPWLKPPFFFRGNSTGVF